MTANSGKQKRRYEGKAIYINGEEMPLPKHDTTEEAIKAARENLDKLRGIGSKSDETLRAEAALDNQRDKYEAVTKIKPVQIRNIDVALDKVNDSVWNGLEGSTRDGQLAYTITLGKNGDDVNATYAISWDNIEELEELKITQKLSRYDRRVYEGVGALFKAGCSAFTLQQVYNAMGREGKASKAAKEKIDKSLTKLSSAHVFLDNGGEHERYENMPYFRWDGSALPMERVTERASIGGNIVDSAIIVYREPPLISFARERNQITTISKRLYDSPLNQTEENIRIEDYLIGRISHMKSGYNKQRRILFDTLFKQTKISGQRQRRRVKAEKVPKLLDHYAKEGFIKGYGLAGDGVTIILSEGECKALPRGAKS